MEAIDQLLERSTRARGSDVRRELPAPPALGVAVVTCMDARIDVYSVLGLTAGEAHVLRNAGGVVTDDTIRSLAISQRRLGTQAVMLIHHTRCGMAGLDEAALRHELTAAGGGQAPAFQLGGFADLRQDVATSIERVRRSPYLLHRDHVRGFVLDVDTGALEEVRQQPPAGG